MSVKTSQPRRQASISVHDETRAVALAAAAAIDDKKGIDIVLLDVSELVVITDVFVIASGASRRHVVSLAEETELRLKAEGRRPLRREGVEDGHWVLLDYGDVVVHVFDLDTRAYYELERLWGNAGRIVYEPAATTA